MKTPVPPPDLDSVLTQAQVSGRLGLILTAQLQSDSATEYHPWDKLRHLTPPPGLTAEEWWVAVKASRFGMLRPLPLLLDVTGRPFRFAITDDLLRGIEEVSAQAKEVIAFPEAVTNDQTRNQYLVSALVEEAIRSSQLEGASTTRQVAREMLRSGRSARTRSERMILNNYRAMNLVTQASNQPLTPAFVKEIHATVTDGTLADQADSGRIQTDDATRVAVYDEADTLLHRPPPAAALPARLAALCAFANGDQNDGPYIPPLLRAFALHFMIGYDHYFADGNGRTARAVFYWSMLHQGFWLTEFVPVSRLLVKAPSQYARSFLLCEQDDGDLTYFFIYHLGIMRRALVDLGAYLARKMDEERAVRAKLGDLQASFNHRQLAVVDQALHDPTLEFTVKSHANAHRVTIETARTDLAGLTDLNYLERLIRGRQHVWLPGPSTRALRAKG